MSDKTDVWQGTLALMVLKTIETMAHAGASCLAIDAGKCLFLDGDKIIAAADQAGIAIVAGSVSE